jgi:hypothetical protein
MASGPMLISTGSNWGCIIIMCIPYLKGRLKA